MKSKLLILIAFLCFQLVSAQTSLENFFKPSDTLNQKRLKGLIITEVAATTALYVSLYQLWYANYPSSKFHFINDNSEWLQMDKAGHVFSAYHLGKLGAESLKWAGVSRNNQLIYGATYGLVVLTGVEIMDGFSKQWGASSGDIIANAAGTSLFVGQELLWNEQRIVPKFSFHFTSYASRRPELLGNSWNEQLLKDYNGQTYWLSCNVQSFFKQSNIPKWLNLAFGYGAEGMITGEKAFVNTIFLPERERYRQFYLSLDVDLTKIPTNSHFIKTLFSLFNTIKIPAPTLELKGSGGIKFHIMYF